jgi:hypothetical protein
MAYEHALKMAELLAMCDAFKVRNFIIQTIFIFIFRSRLLDTIILIRKKRPVFDYIFSQYFFENKFKFKRPLIKFIIDRDHASLFIMKKSKNNCPIARKSNIYFK